MRVAAIDCGTNSLRLLVAEAGGQGPGEGPTDVLRRTEVVRLGEGVDASGAISAEAMGRALAVTADYALACEELGVERMRFVATSASRDARNAADFVAGVRGCLAGYPWGRHVEPEVIGGDAEAALSFAGATAAVAAAGHPGDYLVVDLGGGSTEFARGAADLQRAASLDIGCVRLTERFLRADPPAPGQVAALRAEIAAALEEVEARVGWGSLGTLVGLAGTVTTITAHALGLPTYADARVHLATLTCEDTLAACEDLVAMPRAARAALPVMHPGRVDVIVAGALVWGAVVARARAAAGIERVVTSVHDILDGIAAELAAGST